MLSFILQVTLLEVDLYLQQNKFHLLKQKSNLASASAKKFSSYQENLVTQDRIFAIMILFFARHYKMNSLLDFTVVKKMFQLTTLVYMVCNFSQNIVIFVNNLGHLTFVDNLSHFRFVYRTRLSAWAVFIEAR